MTNGSSDRLDRIEALIESNARAIQAAADERAELRQAMIRLADSQVGIANILASLDSDRPTILRKLNAIENKIDRLLGGSDQPQ